MRISDAIKKLKESKDKLGDIELIFYGQDKWGYTEWTNNFNIEEYRDTEDTPIEYVCVGLDIVQKT